MEKLDLPPEILEQLEQKKSQEISRILSIAEESDIGFEEYLKYIEHLDETLSLADEIYLIRDESSDRFYSFIKHFKNYSYYVLCLKEKLAVDGEEKTMYLPILSFPSRGVKLYEFYSNGEVIKKNLIN